MGLMLAPPDPRREVSALNVAACRPKQTVTQKAENSSCQLEAAGAQRAELLSTDKLRQVGLFAERLGSRCHTPYVMVRLVIGTALC